MLVGSGVFLTVIFFGVSPAEEDLFSSMRWGRWQVLPQVTKA